MTFTPTGARELASRLASDQPEQALSVARAIKAPWFRCQALSHVARYWPDAKYVCILKEAVRAADLQDQVFNQVAVSAWPIRAYLERGNPSPAEKLLVARTRSCDAIENMGSRSEALFAIFEASRPFAIELWKPVFWALVKAAEPTLSWRQLRNLKNAVAMTVSDHAGLAHQALEKLSEPKNVSTIRRYIDTPITETPRAYFKPSLAERAAAPAQPS